MVFEHLHKEIVVACILLASVLSRPCQAQTKSTQQTTVDTTKLARQLQYYYSKTSTKDSTKYKKLFFKTFPNSFHVFNQLYGYEENGDLHQLYNVQLKHLRLFCHLTDVVGINLYYEKLIKLGIGGRWMADAVNILQHCMSPKVESQLKITTNILARYSDKKVESFWFFLFDGPANPVKIPINIKKLQHISPRNSKLARKAFQKVQDEDWGG